MFLSIYSISEIGHTVPQLSAFVRLYIVLHSVVREPEFVHARLRTCVNFCTVITFLVSVLSSCMFSFSGTCTHLRCIKYISILTRKFDCQQNGWQ